MRKQYISIEDMATQNQNSWNEPITAEAPIFSKGRTSIDTIEERINTIPKKSKQTNEFEYNQRERNPYIQYNSNPCYENAKHMQSCPLCNKLFNTDPTLYLIIIAVLIVIIIILIIKRI